MTASEACLLALDIGSSSVRARLYDGELRPLPMADGTVSPYPWRTEGGAMEGDPAAMLARFASVVDAAVRSADRLGVRIAAVGTATFWHSLLGLDGAGRPLTPVLGWGDARAAMSLGSLRDRFGDHQFRDLTGCFLQASYPAVKLRWLADTRPETVAATRTWTSFADFVMERLFRDRRTSRSLASATGLMDTRGGVWAPAVIAAAGIDVATLPEIMDLEPLSGLRGEWSRRWPALARIPWYPPIGDGACANVGAGAIGAERPCLTVGTSAAVRVVWRERPGLTVPPDLWSYHLDADYRVAGGALSNGGNALTYLLEIFPGLDLTELSRTLAEEDPDRHGLTVLPSLLPERALGWTHEESAAIVGMRIDASPLRIAQAWLEALAQRTAELLGRVESAFGPAVEVRATGGGLHAVPGWLRAFADAAGRPARMAVDPEATSRGAAVVAARQLGWIPALEAAPDGRSEVITPDPARGDAHLRAIARRNRLSRALAALR